MIAKLQPRKSRRKANDLRIAQKRAKGMSLTRSPGAKALQTEQFFSRWRG